MIDFTTSPACRRIYFNTLVIEFLPLQKCTPSAGTRAVPNAPRQPPALFLLLHNRKCPKLPMHFLHKPLAHPSPPPAHRDPIAIRIPIASRCTGAAPARENMQHIDSSLRSHRSHPPPALAREESPHPTFNFSLRSSISAPRHLPPHNAACEPTSLSRLLLLFLLLRRDTAGLVLPGAALPAPRTRLTCAGCRGPGQARPELPLPLADGAGAAAGARRRRRAGAAAGSGGRCRRVTPPRPSARRGRCRARCRPRPAPPRARRAPRLCTAAGTARGRRGGRRRGRGRDGESAWCPPVCSAGWDSSGGSLLATLLLCVRCAARLDGSRAEAFWSMQCL